ncbi:hypothetical protein EDB84DRAFT_1079193 [Lactarius hengduanensis]|nr:hypothetical protein EDB84DRAFT_1079193 [Lactarius hengduanensis]
MLCRSIRGVTQVEEAENGESGKLLCACGKGDPLFIEYCSRALIPSMFKGKRVNDRGPGSLPPRTENREEDEFLSERMWTREGNRCSKQCTPTYTGVPDVGGVWLELARNVYCHSHDGSRTRRFDAQDRDPGRRRDGDTQLNGGPAECLASEVTRVALEVGTQGILGGQARVESVQGTWADSILNVNKMASNLTDQVRSISGVTQAVALGDFSKQVEVDEKCSTLR